MLVTSFNSSFKISSKPVQNGSSIALYYGIRYHLIVTIPWSKQIQKTKKKVSNLKADVPFIFSIVRHAKTVYNNCTRGCFNCSCFFSRFVLTKAPGPLTPKLRLELLELRLERAEKEEAARVVAGLVTSHHSVFFLQFMVYLFICNLKATLYSKLMVRRSHLKEQNRTVISPNDEALSMI